MGDLEERLSLITALVSVLSIGQQRVYRVNEDQLETSPLQDEGAWLLQLQQTELTGIPSSTSFYNTLLERRVSPLKEQSFLDMAIEMLEIPEKQGKRLKGKVYTKARSIGIWHPNALYRMLIEEIEQNLIPWGERHGLRLDAIQRTMGRSMHERFHVGDPFFTPETLPDIPLESLQDSYAELIARAKKLFGNNLSLEDVLITPPVAPTETARARLRKLERIQTRYGLITTPGREIRQAYFDESGRLQVTYFRRSAGYDALEIVRTTLLRGLTRGQLAIADKGVYHQLTRQGTLDQIPKKERRWPDPERTYHEQFEGKTRGYLAREAPGLLTAIRRIGKLEIVPTILRTPRQPKERVNEEYGPTAAEVWEYYVTYHNGMSGKQLESVKPGLVQRMRREGLAHQLPQLRQFGNPLVYAAKYFPGKLAEEIKPVNPALYQCLIYKELCESLPVDEAFLRKKERINRKPVKCYV